MPRLQRKRKRRRAPIDSDDMAWIFGEPMPSRDNPFFQISSDVAQLEQSLKGIPRGFAGKSHERSPLMPDDVRAMPIWKDEIKALRRLRELYDSLSPEYQAEVPEDRKALLMAVDENAGDPDLWWERKREEQAEIDKRTGRKEGQLLRSDGSPYYVKDLEVEGELRQAARKRKNLRAVFDETPMHIRIRVPEAWAILDVQSREDLWDELLEHHSEIPLDKPWTLNYHPDATKYTVKSWSAKDAKKRRLAVQREP